LNYKILQENIGIKSLKDVVLENKEITKNEINFLLNPTSEYVENPFKLKNMSEGIKLFMEELEEESKIGVLVDSDVDGFTSGALVYLFLINECQYPKEKIQIFHHQKKTHGLSNEKLFKEIKKSDINFLIIPDAGSNDIIQIKELLKIGKRILILDHHQINDGEQNTLFSDQNGNIVGVIINNQLDEYSSSFAGVGVTYKFLTALTEDELIHYMDLVAIGNIADSMLINDFELRYVVDKGLKNINNELIKEFIVDAKLEEDLTPTDISFNVANKINAVIRYGSLQEKEDLFKALIGEEEEIEYTPRKSKSNPNPQTEIQTLQKAMVRISKSIKTKQDNAKKKSVEKCKQFVIENNLNENKAIVIIDEDGEIIDRKITGLIAMNLVSIYRKSVVLLGKTKEKYTGSIRGYGVDSFKDILETTEIVKITGHNNSAGIEVEFKDIPRLIKRINRAMEDIEVIPPCTLVDCKIDLNNIKEKEMQEVLNLKPIWHQHCTEPLFLIEDLIIDSKKIRNPYATLITFNVNGIEIKKEYCSGVWKREFLKEDVVKFGKPTLKCNLIVKIDYDNYKNKPCLSIVEAESEVIKDKKQDSIPF
jgi:single-stranded-DNA-specific exonuclease